VPAGPLSPSALQSPGVGHCHTVAVLGLGTVRVVARDRLSLQCCRSGSRTSPLQPVLVPSPEH